MNPQKPQKPKQKTPDFGEPMDLDALLDFATIDHADVESAAQWWDETASSQWQGALDSEPIDDNA